MVRARWAAMGEQDRRYWTELAVTEGRAGAEAADYNDNARKRPKPPPSPPVPAPPAPASPPAPAPAAPAPDAPAPDAPAPAPAAAPPAAQEPTVVKEEKMETKETSKLRKRRRKRVEVTAGVSGLLYLGITIHGKVVFDWPGPYLWRSDAAGGRFWRIWRPPAPQVGGGGGPEYTGDSLIWPGLPPDNQGSVRNPETPATLQ